MSLARPILVDSVPAYQPAGGEVLRTLDATEHNMERLNARARGSARTYLSAVVEGPLARRSLEEALDVLTSRHPLLRARIVRTFDGALAYAPTLGDRADGSARVPLTYTVAEPSRWRELVETDINGGAIATDRGPLFALGVIVPPGLEDGESGQRVLVLVGHHCANDGLSSVALLHELLEQLARRAVLAPLEAPGLVDPFCLDVPAPELAEIEQAARSALDSRDPARRPELETLLGRLEALEERLLASKDADGRHPAALKTVHGWLATLAAELQPAGGIVPEVVIAPGPTRYDHARTALVHWKLEPGPTAALRRAAKERGLTQHGVFAAAVLLGLAERARRVAPSTPLPERLALATAANIRKQLVPPLAPHDVRMAVDVIVSRVPIAPGARFWDLARAAGDDVSRAVVNGRALSSYFRTVPRDFADVPPGVPLPVLSNIGRAELATRYGPLRLLDVGAAMTTHGSFQLAMVVLTFDDRLSASFYCETPTVSRASLERFAASVRDTLTRVAGGEEPLIQGGP